MCLFRGEVKRMENFGEKMGRKFFWSVFGWMRRMKNKWWGLCIFSSDLPKSFLFKIKRKLKRKIVHHFWIKMLMYNCTFTMLLFFTFFFPLFLIFFLFLLIYWQACLVYIYIYIYLNFFVCLFRCDLFYFILWI